MIQNDISDLIEAYLKKISGDHHKTRDGYFSVECVWDGWAQEVTPKYIAVHGGYINDLDAEYRDTFEEALDDLRVFLIECINNYVEEEPF